MTQDRLDAILDIAREAGEIAVSLRHHGLETRSKDGGSPVTNADLAVDEFLKTRLGALDPEMGWLSEETADSTDRLTMDQVYVVDPIDGTVAFLKGKAWWSISIGLVQANRPVLGVIHAPDTAETFWAVEGQGAYCNGQSIRASATSQVAGMKMLGDAKMFGHPAWAQPWPEMQIETRNSIAYRMCLVANGSFDAALTLASKNEWDLAAGDLIAREAGAKVSDHQGNSFRYNQPRPLFPSLICSGPDLFEAMLERVSPIRLGSGR